MSKDINLLRDRRAGVFQSENIRRTLWIFAGVSLSISVISTVVIFFLKIQSNLPSLQENESRLLTSLSTQRKKVVQYLHFTDRLTNINNVVAKRVAFDKKIDEIQQIIPEGIKVNSLTLDKKRLSMSITASSLVDADNFMKNLKETVDNNKLFSKVNFNGITLNEKKIDYTFSIDADLL